MHGILYEKVMMEYHGSLKCTILWYSISRVVHEYHGTIMVHVQKMWNAIPCALYFTLPHFVDMHHNSTVVFMYYHLKYHVKIWCMYEKMWFCITVPRFYTCTISLNIMNTIGYHRACPKNVV